MVVKQLWLSVSDEPTGLENETASDETHKTTGEIENAVVAGPEIDTDHPGLMTIVVPRSNIRNKRSGASARRKQRHT